jgi:hypothetical protein
VQDEIDHVFAHGKDNANLIQFYNLGYERGTVVDRCDKDTDKILSTPAYCPKAFAGLRTARLDPTTKSRTIIVNMRPQSKAQMRAEYVDLEELSKLRKEVDDWAARQETLDAIAAVVIPEDDIDFMINRDRQIMKPLLVIAKSVSDEWYVKALSAVKYFIGSTKKDAMVPRKILIGSYTIFKNLVAEESKFRIPSDVLLPRLHDLGIPDWVSYEYLSRSLSGYDENIRPKQMRFPHSPNPRQGYEWTAFEDAWATYHIKEEVDDLENVSGVRGVGASGRTPSGTEAAETIF